MILINGEAEDRIIIADRGLQYGDGLFETIAFRNGIAEFIDAHLQRLLLGCKRLNIPFNQIELLQQELDTVYQSLNGPSAVIKIIITRGVGGRGYKSDNSIEPTRIISTHPLPNYPQSFVTDGISVQFCHHLLSENPVLAGLKHLNRLDNVLARNEWDDPMIAEGLMFDQSHHLIEGTMSNVFVVINDQLITPLLNASGVAGIMRATIINIAKQLGLIVKENTLTRDVLISANELFICNSLNGIWPVTKIIDTEITYQHGPITKKLQLHLSEMER